jgi:hypothetical protein
MVNQVSTGARIGQKLCEHFGIKPGTCSAIEMNITGYGIAKFKFELMNPLEKEQELIDILTQTEEPK